MANYYRHQGLSDDGLNGEVSAILSDRLAENARLLGALFRVAYALTASMAGVLPETRLDTSEEGRLSLYLPNHLSGLQGERLSKRLNALAKLTGRQEAVVAVR
jgi:exopolyphosphatase/guanosine-5'-triphosphate,3'-diphosphate pyrophosphatase